MARPLQQRELDAMQLKSLKGKVTLVVTGCFVTVVALVSLAQAYFARAEMQRLLQAQQFTLVSLVAGDIDEKIALRLASLSSVAAIVPVPDLSTPRLIRNDLDNQPDLQSQFDSIAVISPAGHVLAAVPAGPERLALNLRDRPWLRQVVQSTAPVVSEPMRSRLTGNPQIVLAAPIFGRDHKVAAVLAGTLDLFKPNFLGNIGAASVGATGSFALFTRDRRILMSRDRDRIMTRGPARGVSSSFDRATAGEDGSEESVNSRGFHALFSYKQLRTVPWVLVAALPVEEAYAPIAAAQRHVALTATLLVAILAPLLWFATRHLLGPLLALQDTIRRIRRGGPGDLPAVLMRRADEIGELAADFSAMMRERSEAEWALRESQRQLSLAMEGSQLALFDWNIAAGDVFLSEQWSVMLGGAPAVTRTTFAALAQLVHPDDFERLRASLHAVLKGDRTYYRTDHRVRSITGEWLWIESHGEVTARDAGGRALRMVGTNADIGERKRTEHALLASRAELERAAEHDPLTALPNRSLLDRRLEEGLARSRRSGQPLALCFLDLDGFKSVNDTLGHAAGDALLKEVARRLLRCVREIDTVARLGGDEFVILLEEVRGPADAKTVAGKIMDALKQDFELGTGRITTSIGIALGGGDAPADELLELADIALYRAKRAGRNRFHMATYVGAARSGPARTAR
jgi:diguanylate cyclase (GGDEF)-like protein/PAS domain S-box-containing protein